MQDRDDRQLQPQPVMLHGHRMRSRLASSWRFCCWSRRIHRIQSPPYKLTDLQTGAFRFVLEPPMLLLRQEYLDLLHEFSLFNYTPDAYLNKSRKRWLFQGPKRCIITGRQTDVG